MKYNLPNKNSWINFFSWFFFFFDRTSQLVGSWLLDQELNLCPRIESSVSTSGPPGKSLIFFFNAYTLPTKNLRWHIKIYM